MSRSGNRDNADRYKCIHAYGCDREIFPPLRLKSNFRGALLNMRMSLKCDILVTSYKNDEVPGVLSPCSSAGVVGQKQVFLMKSLKSRQPISMFLYFKFIIFTAGFPQIIQTSSDYWGYILNGMTTQRMASASLS